MEKFINNTQSNQEKAVKVGTNAPKDSVVLAWFNSESISPGKNVVIADLSETILENRISAPGGTEMMFADELGILRRFDNSSSILSDNISVSNMFVDKITSSKLFNQADLNPQMFIHYYYVSKYFTVLPASFSLFSINDYVDMDKISSLGIKVIDQSGKDYVYENTNKPKYKILLEPYKTDDNLGDIEIPYRILVFLDATTPNNLKLIYNKFEVDDKGKRFNSQLRYTEQINSVKLFKDYPEESFVIDPNYYGLNNYSIKKIDNKFTETVASTAVIQNGYQVIVPSKAVKDYRTYEVFNWRIIGKIKRSLNLKEVNFGQNRSLNACILYSSSKTNANAYALYRLQYSPFNLSGLVFNNPLTALTDKSKSDYWLVDIDSVSSPELENFDVILWSPDSLITAGQAEKINNYVLNKYGTVILDLYNCPDAQRLFCGTHLKMTDGAKASVEQLNTSNYLIDSNKNGGWDINSNVFEKTYYGVYGARLTTSLVEKVYKYFNDTTNSNSIVKVGADSSQLKSIATIVSSPTPADSLAKGNVVATTFPIMEYCNKIYSSSSSEISINDNTSDTHFGNIEETNIFSSVIEGPFKLLYNSISYALYCRAQLSAASSVLSSLVNIVTDWNSSWVMYSDAMLDFEKSDFDSISIDASTSVYARNLTRETASNNTSIFDYFKHKASLKLSQLQASLLSELEVDDIDFYVEITNPDVKVRDAAVVIDPLSPEVNIPSSYYLHKVNDLSNSTYNAARNELHAYTEKYSPSLRPLSGMGAHVLMERPINSSATKNLVSLLSPSSGFHSYPLKLSSSYVTYEGSDKPTILNAKLNGKLTYRLSARMVKQETNIITPQPSANTIKAVSIKSAVDDLNLMRAKSSTETSNIFPYTGDIDIHGDTRMWQYGSSSTRTVSTSTNSPTATSVDWSKVDMSQITINPVSSSSTNSNTAYSNSSTTRITPVPVDRIDSGTTSANTSAPSSFLSAAPVTSSKPVLSIISNSSRWISASPFAIACTEQYNVGSFGGSFDKVKLTKWSDGKYSVARYNKTDANSSLFAMRDMGYTLVGVEEKNLNITSVKSKYPYLTIMSELLAYKVNGTP